MKKTYLLRLSENELGQILEGLQARAESWLRTADYFRKVYNPDVPFVIEECNGEHEANEIALFYSRIIRNLERQRDEQKSQECELYIQGKADGQANLIQRILANRNIFQRLDADALHERLLELQDEICDD
jgi:hypothetical protein